MRERLIQYVDLLFAGVPDSEEIRQEILQNTLDRYDDLVSQGKSEEAAYRLAISGIGDINEILGQVPSVEAAPLPREDDSPNRDRKTRAIAIVMYILCPVPLFILSELGHATLGLCLTLGLVAAATYTIILSGKKDTEQEPSAKAAPAQSPRRKAIADIIRTAALVVFLVLSFLTGAWYITWLIFPIAGCVRGLIYAIWDLKEAAYNEN